MSNEIKHSVIIKSNSLINAVYKMPINSAHLLNILLRNVIANDILSDGGKLHVVTAVDFAKLLGLKNNQYRELKKATKFLLSSVIKVRIDRFSYQEYSIFDAAYYSLSKGYTSLAFSRNFLPFIQALKGDFTRLKLSETLRFKKFSSVRTYEKLMQYMRPDCTGWWRVNIDELKNLLNVERNHIYWRTSHFNAKIFRPAILEISQKLNWDIKVKTIRVGRTITEFEIHFKDLNCASNPRFLGNKRTRLNTAIRAAEARAKISKLAHHKKIGIS
jgi:plasmid replication initiation protein